MIALQKPVRPATGGEPAGAPLFYFKEILRQTSYYFTEKNGERLFTYRTTDSIPDLPMHKKLGIIQKGTQYINGKNDLLTQTDFCVKHNDKR